jgi:hypothetical protein
MSRGNRQNGVNPESTERGGKVLRLPEPENGAFRLDVYQSYIRAKQACFNTLSDSNGGSCCD